MDWNGVKEGEGAASLKRVIDRIAADMGRGAGSPNEENYEALKREVAECSWPAKALHLLPWIFGGGR